MFKVGQKVIVITYIAVDAYVMSVGRKWNTYAETNEIGARQYRFLATTGELEKGGGYVWPSREAYETHCATIKAWRAFQRGVSLGFKTPVGVTIERLQAISSELGFELSDIPVSNAISKVR